MTKHDDLVRIILDGSPAGVVRCPFHGDLDASTEYTPGPAACGCVFLTAPGGLLRAQRGRAFMAEITTAPADDGRQVPGESAKNTPQVCEPVATTPGNRNIAVNTDNTTVDSQQSAAETT